MELKAVIFDMDGTLVDNVQFHKLAWLTFLGKHGIDMDAEAFHAQNHGTIDEMITRFFGQDISDTKRRALGIEKESTYRELYKDHIRETKGLTGLLEILQNRGVKIGLATMGDKTNIDFTIDALGIRPYFNVIAGGDEIERGKPDPEIFNTVVSRLGVQPEECVVFEDSFGGITAALQAGIKVIGITTTEQPEDLLRHGCYKTIDDFTGLDLDGYLPE